MRQCQSCGILTSYPKQCLDCQKYHQYIQPSSPIGWICTKCNISVNPAFPTCPKCSIESNQHTNCTCPICVPDKIRIVIDSDISRGEENVEKK